VTVVAACAPAISRGCSRLRAGASSACLPASLSWHTLRRQRQSATACIKQDPTGGAIRESNITQASSRSSQNSSLGCYVFILHQSPNSLNWPRLPGGQDTAKLTDNFKSCLSKCSRAAGTGTRTGSLSLYWEILPSHGGQSAIFGENQPHLGHLFEIVPFPCDSPW
jgi:hypothetical protein